MRRIGRSARLTLFRTVCSSIAALSLLAETVPAAAQAPVAAAFVAAPDPAATATSPPALNCAAVAAERTELEALHVQVKRAISDLALGRPQRRRHVGAGDVGRAAAGTAASLLLPFGIGIALNVATGAAAQAGKKKHKSAPEILPDVPALIDRQHAIEARLRALAASPCAAAPAAPVAASPAPAAASIRRE